MMLRVAQIEVGIKGQTVTVRGSAPPDEKHTYDQEQELELDLPLARELYRLLGKLIPLAEESKPPASVARLAGDDAA